MSWTKVLSVDSLAPGARQVVKVGENSILLINNNGQFHAVGNRCPHLKLSMTKGKITEDGAIVCPWHRSSFDLCTGAVKDWITWPPVGRWMGCYGSMGWRSGLRFRQGFVFIHSFWRRQLGTQSTCAFSRLSCRISKRYPQPNPPCPATCAFGQRTGPRSTGA